MKQSNKTNNDLKNKLVWISLTSDKEAPQKRPCVILSNPIDGKKNK